MLPENNTVNMSAPPDLSSDPGDAYPAPFLGPVAGPVEHQDRRNMDLTLTFGMMKVGASAVVLFVISYSYLMRVSRLDAEARAQDSEVPSNTLEDGKLKAMVRYAYSMPTLATQPVTALISVFVLSFYSRRGADLPFMALVVALARSFDMVIDPIMSSLSDRCPHLSGRRKPWIILGAPLYGIFLYALLSPPYMSCYYLSAWFAVVYTLFYFSSTAATIPYDAWGPELAEDSNERARLFFLSGLFDGGGTLFAFALPFLGFTAFRNSGASNNICLPREDIVTRCARGETCALFNENGPGYEFALNTSFVKSLIGFNKELLTYDCDQARPFVQAGSVVEGNAIETFCACMQTCTDACATSNRAWGFATAGAIFAIWFVVSSYVCCSMVQERPVPTGGRRAPPLVPALLGSFRNPTFVALLPAWACDAIAGSLLLALCPYVVMYVIAPEYQSPKDNLFQLDCKEGARGISSSLQYDQRCNTMVVLGACVCAALIVAVLATPVWMWAVRKFGKVHVWLFWSLVSALANFMFACLRKSFLFSLFVVCCINGIPIAAKFLSDAILADIIDYEEFLSGTRREATYTMFRALLPKLMAIPASALPLSIINAAGHIASENGIIMWQPPSVRWSISIMAGIVSGCASLLAWKLKKKYPLNSDALMQQVTEGIANHKAGKAATDPLTGQQYTLTTFTEEELVGWVWHLDHFIGVEVVEAYAANREEGAGALCRKTSWQLLAAIFLLVASVAGFGASVPLIRNQVWSFIPTVLAAGVGGSFVCFGLAFFRRRAALALAEAAPNPTVVEKVLSQRKALLVLENARREREGMPPVVPEAPKVPLLTPTSTPTPTPSLPAPQASGSPAAAADTTAPSPPAGAARSRSRRAPKAAEKGPEEDEEF